MQFVDNDMDDLYRRAAEDYPLKTGAPDWEKLLQKMEQQPGLPVQDKKENKAKFLWLLLLLPLFFICTHYSGQNENGSLQPTNKTNVQSFKKVMRQEANVSDEALLSKQKTLVEDGKTVENFTAKENPLGLENSIAVGKINVEQQTALPYRNAREEKSLNIGRSLSSATSKAVGENLSSVTEENDNNIEIGKQATTNEQVKNDNANTSKQTTQEVIKANSDSAELSLPAKTKKQKTVKGLYWGILAGPDFSMVKSAKVHGLGLSYGLVVGYRITPSWSMESGILWDKKDYQSEGQYFKTEKTGWPQHTTVLDISGTCHMFEVPITVRYDFYRKPTHSWFATGGMSSYFMKKEKYDYNVERYGVQYYGHKTYKNSSTNWFSVMHLSVGYQKPLGKIGNLRIEPYVKLPVSGVGVGSLPLRSTGVYVGLTRSIP